LSASGFKTALRTNTHLYHLSASQEVQHSNRHCRGGGGRVRGVGVVMAAAALLLAGVGGDALADIARVGKASRRMNITRAGLL